MRETTAPRYAESRVGCVTPDGTEPGALRCRCLWHGERCLNRATQEDGLCNWCGNGRTVDQQRNDPKAVVGPDGEFFGIGGTGQLHDSRPGRPGACWYPDSGREVIG